MKVLYDHQIFSLQRYGGISRYHAELNKMNDNSRVSILITQNEYINSRFNFKMNIPIFIYFIYFINQIYSIFLLIFSKYDVFHPTYYDAYFLNFLKRPFVLTIHDLIPERNQEEYKKIIKSKSKLIYKADKIICISENTKLDLLKFYNIDENKVVVIYHSTDFSMIKRKSIPINIEYHYILFVGKRDNYKNFIFVIDALKEFLTTSKFFLLCTGGGIFNEYEKRYLIENKLINKVIHTSSNEIKLKALYNNAEFFIFPSSYEGFGLPILEAFSCECPILLNNSSCLPEIAKDGAIYFNDNDKNSLKSSVDLMLKHNIQKNIISRANSRLLIFNVEERNLSTLKVYDNLSRSNIGY